MSTWAANSQVIFSDLKYVDKDSGTVFVRIT